MPINYLFYLLIMSQFFFGCKSHERHPDDMIITNREVIQNSSDSSRVMVHREIGDGEDNKKYLIKLNMKAHNKFYIRIQNTNSTSFTLNDEKIETYNKADIGLIYQMKRDSSGNYEATITYDKFQIKIKNRGSDEEVIDSQKDTTEQDRLERILYAIKGKSIILSFDEGGKFLSVRGKKEIAAEVMRVAFADGDAEVTSMVNALLEQLTGGDFVNDNIQSGFLIVPDSAIYIGDSWKSNSSQAGEISYTLNTNSTLKEINGGIAIIKASSVVKGIDEKNIDVSGNKVMNDLKGTRQSVFKIDANTGMLKKTSTQTTLQGNVRVQFNSFPIKIRQTKDIEITDILK
jgi:hypothetical protein